MQPFEPLTLNDETVQAIYDRCLANDDTPEEDRAQSMAFLGVCGYARDVFQKVFFSRARIAEDRKTLYYLYGQLAGVHEPEDLPYAPLRLSPSAAACAIIAGKRGSATGSPC